VGNSAIVTVLGTVADKGLRGLSAALYARKEESSDRLAQSPHRLKNDQLAERVPHSCKTLLQWKVHRQQIQPGPFEERGK
jgi:hypothetical protein